MMAAKRDRKLQQSVRRLAQAHAGRLGTVEKCCSPARVRERSAVVRGPLGDVGIDRGGEPICWDAGPVADLGDEAFRACRKDAEQNLVGWYGQL
jgi:hypothetical protein